MTSEVIPILVATRREVEKIYSMLSDYLIKGEWNLFRVGEYTFTIYYIGVGKVSAAINTTLLLNRNPPRTLVNFGAVGKLSDKVNLGDLVRVGRVFEYDLNTGDGCKETCIPCYNLYPNDISLGTCDNFEHQRELLKTLPKEVKLDILDMEGASIKRAASVINPLCKIVMIKLVTDNGRIEEYTNSNILQEYDESKLLKFIIDSL